MELKFDDTPRYKKSFIKREDKLTPWAKVDHDFLANVMTKHGPTLGDLTRLVVKGLSDKQQEEYFRDISKLIEKYPLIPQSLVLDIKITQEVMMRYVELLLALSYVI